MFMVFRGKTVLVGVEDCPRFGECYRRLDHTRAADSPNFYSDLRNPLLHQGQKQPAHFLIVESSLHIRELHFWHALAFCCCCNSE